ncbi:DUF1799 domain-containing protein [Alysiella crassa]|uniref:DUF1799 domain-containing protein n=1 Tax=Alysiella crassa TaxID=153491 RepID=UPI0006913EEF|nr:DUF1799 domain-containing protein [Alysiella crassa]UOP05871.1 DUF1799 domain-containing protein [Alysiella crassa]
MTLADLADNQTEVWAHHWQAVELFQQMSSQWRMGFGGAVGLDYAVLFKLMDLQGIEKSRKLELLAQIQVCESAALDIFHRDKK